jgi:hypothetical protein
MWFLSTRLSSKLLFECHPSLQLQKEALLDLISQLTQFLLTLFLLYLDSKGRWGGFRIRFTYRSPGAENQGSESAENPLFPM